MSKNCIDCNCIINKSSKRCKSCHGKFLSNLASKIKRPTGENSPRYIKRIFKKCIGCEKIFTEEKWVVKNRGRKYCSHKCYLNNAIGKNAANWQGKTKIKNCKRCGKQFLSQEKLNKYFCSKKCSNVFNKKTGVNSPAWRGGVTPIHEKIRRTAEYKEWRNFVFERDNHTCQICGIRGGELRANHIKKFADHPLLRTKHDNGITICKKCDIEMVLRKEEEWESYFNFNLKERIYG